MADLVVNLKANDQASATIKKVGENARTEAEKILQSDKKISASTKTAARAKQEQLTLSQKVRFAIAKEAAAGNKLKTSLVKRQQALAGVERKLRAAIKAGDAESVALAKQTVELRKNIEALKEKETLFPKMSDSAKGWLKVGAAVTAGVAAAGVAVTMLTNKFGQYGDAMIKGAQRLNLTTDEFQKLDFAMKISGTSMDSQKASLVRFARTARDAATGVRVAEESFHRLGISAKDSQGNYKGMNTLLLEVSDAFKKLPANAEKTAISMDLFGRSGSELAQFLNLGSEGLQELGAELETLDGIMSEESAKAAEEYVDALTRMQTALTSVAREIADETIPVYTRTMNQIAETTIDLKRAWRPAFQDMADWTHDAAQIIVPVLGFITKAFVGVATIVALEWKGLLVALNHSVSGIVQTMNLVIEGFNSFLPASKKMTLFHDDFADTADSIVGEMEDIVDASAATMKGIDDIGKALMGSTEIRKESTEAKKEENEVDEKRLTTLREIRKAEKEAAREAAKTAKAKAKREAKFQRDFDRNYKKGVRDANKFAAKQEKEADALAKTWASSANSIGSDLAAGFLEAQTQQELFNHAFKVGMTSMLDMMQDFIIKEIMMDAASAAVKAGKSQAGIPVAGPYLAAAAAATVFALLKGFISKMNRGGIVPGMGNTDSVPAMLTPGEIVLPKALSAHLLNVVGQSGSGEMASGGVVRGGGGGIVVNFNEAALIQRSPAEMDRFIRDSLLPSLRRLKRKGAHA